MNERQEKILAAVVEEFTKTGLPVGSGVLSESYGFTVSPATLRGDMVSLEKEGLLHQPHTSAGRVPTDAGYRYFVEKIMPDRDLSKADIYAMQKELLQLKAKNTRLTRTTAKLLSTLSGYVAISGVPGRDDFSEFGLRSLLNDAEGRDLDQICQIAEALDYIDESCEDLMKDLEGNETKIYIGGENPLAKTQDYSMVVSQYDAGNDEKGIVALIGPKNMKYDKTKKLIDTMKKMIGGASLFMIIIL